jgi:hypothetical protein
MLDTTKAESKSTTEDSRFSAPAITLPKGGGAISGMGEKFGANPVTGTGSMTVPLPLARPRRVWPSTLTGLRLRLGERALWLRLVPRNTRDYSQDRQRSTAIPG